MRFKQADWKRNVFGLHGAFCLMCLPERRVRAVQAHHVCAKQRIKADTRKTKAVRAELLWDPRNGIPTCLRCHERHEGASERIPVAKLPEVTIAWLQEFDYDYILDSAIYT